MGAIRNNTGKWKAFIKGRLYSGAGVGQNLNSDLQKNIADELDRLLKALGGLAVTGSSSWVVSPTVNPLEVKVSAGEGFFDGQIGRTDAEFVVTPQLSPSTNGIQIYIELDDTNSTYDLVTASWPVRVAWAGPLTTLPNRAILLATVNTPASGAIDPASITDKRKVIARDYDAVSGVTDTVALDDVAVSLRNRFDMVLTQIRTIIGRSSWKSQLPGSGDASLNGLWDKFHPTDGHTHGGVGRNGPRIVASVVDVTPTAGGTDDPPFGITANRVQAALEQLHERKLSRYGQQPMAGKLILYRDPEEDLEAATRRFVLQRVSNMRVTSTGIRSGVSVSSTEASLTVMPVLPSTTPAPISISARGTIVKFESNCAVEASIQFSTGGGSWYGVLRFRLYRDSVFFDEVSLPVYIQTDQEGTHRLVYQIPVFYDPSPGGTVTAPQARTYDLKWQFQLESITGSAVRTHFATAVANNQQSRVPGRWYAIES